MGGHGDENAKARLKKALSAHGGSSDTIVTQTLCSVGHALGAAASEDELIGVVVGNLDWLSVEIADIQSKRGAPAALLEAYRSRGSGLLEIIGGRFAVALWDARLRYGLVAADRFAQVPVFWSSTADETVVFGPTTFAVNRLLDEPATLSPQGLFNYLYFHMVPGPGSIFRGVNKLMAAHALEFRDGQPRVYRYWVPNFREHADESMREAAEEMLGLLSSSVDRLTRGAEVGAFLSGGLDSSTVAGLLARQQPQPKTYSIGFDAEGYDEISFAETASQQFGTTFNAYYVTPSDVLQALPRIAAAYDEPFGNSSALPAYFCARLAVDDGRERLLGGDGGDELFAGNERYAKQAVFERYQLLPGWLRARLLEPMVRAMPRHVPLVEKARSYIRQAKVPLPDRLQTYNFVNRLGASQIMSAALLEAVDTGDPVRLERDIYTTPLGASRLNRMLYLDWHHTLADNDLRKVTRMCQLAGIEVEYPMLDDRLVEFSTRISSARKMYRGRLRGFYKKAVSDFLPERIINKKKQGFGLPFGVWMANDAALQELASDYLATLRHRDIIRPAFLEELLDLHQAHHAGYYGEMIWILVILALWLDAHDL